MQNFVAFHDLKYNNVWQMLCLTVSCHLEEKPLTVYIKHCCPQECEEREMKTSLLTYII